jgi:hypothetical protein
MLAINLPLGIMRLPQWYSKPQNWLPGKCLWRIVTRNVTVNVTVDIAMF